MKGWKTPTKVTKVNKCSHIYQESKESEKQFVIWQSDEANQVHIEAFEPPPCLPKLISTSVSVTAGASILVGKSRVSRLSN